MRKFFILLVSLLLVVSGTALAQDGNGMTADGFDSPRGVFFGADGTLYVADAGRGGDIPAQGVTGEGQAGGTARLHAVAADGSSSVVAFGFPSLAVRGEVVGLSDVLVTEDAIWLATGQGPLVPAEGNPDNPLAFGVVKLDRETMRMTEFIDIYAYEAANNPANDSLPNSDQPNIDSNVVGIDMAEDGTLYIADAGANTVFQWTAEDGLSVLQAWQDNPVPTDVAIGPEGDIYVSFLTGFPFPENGARIERLSPDGELMETFEGLTTAVNVMVTDDGTIYATQFGTFNPDSGFAPNSGSVVMVTADGLQPVMTELTYPYGIDMNADGMLAVAVNASFSEPGSGAVMVTSPDMGDMGSDSEMNGGEGDDAGDDSDDNGDDPMATEEAGG